MGFLSLNRFGEIVNGEMEFKRGEEMKRKGVVRSEVFFRVVSETSGGLLSRLK